MHEVEFHEPVFVGDVVSFYTETVRVGRTSLTVRVVVEAERWSASPLAPRGDGIRRSGQGDRGGGRAGGGRRSGPAGADPARADAGIASSCNV